MYKNEYIQKRLFTIHCCLGYIILCSSSLRVTFIASFSEAFHVFIVHTNECWQFHFCTLLTRPYTVKSRVLTRPVLKHISFLSAPKMPIFWIEARLEYKQHLLCTYIKGKEKYLELHSYFRKKIKKNVGSLSEKRKTFTKNALD